MPKVSPDTLLSLEDQYVKMFSNEQGKAPIGTPRRDEESLEQPWCYPIVPSHTTYGVNEKVVS